MNRLRLNPPKIKKLQRYFSGAFLWCRGTESNCRHGDFQTKFLKIRKSCNYNRLILFHFFNQLLVSSGTIWKYLTLTGTIWAQFSIEIQSSHHKPSVFSRNLSEHSNFINYFDLSIICSSIAGRLTSFSPNQSVALYGFTQCRFIYRMDVGSYYRVDFR